MKFISEIPVGKCIWGLEFKCKYLLSALNLDDTSKIANRFRMCHILSRWDVFADPIVAPTVLTLEYTF